MTCICVIEPVYNDFWVIKNMRVPPIMFQRKMKQMSNSVGFGIVIFTNPKTHLVEIYLPPPKTSWKSIKVCPMMISVNNFRYHRWDMKSVLVINNFMKWVNNMGDRDRPIGSFVSKYDAIHVQPDSPIYKKGEIASFLVQGLSPPMIPRSLNIIS